MTAGNVGWWRPWLRVVLAVIGGIGGQYGCRGCHSYLMHHEMRAYRERNRRKRVAWADPTPATQSAIIRYLES